MPRPKRPTRRHYDEAGRRLCVCHSKLPCRTRVSFCRVCVQLRMVRQWGAFIHQLALHKRAIGLGGPESGMAGLLAFPDRLRKCILMTALDVPMRD